MQHSQAIVSISDLRFSYHTKSGPLSAWQLAVEHFEIMAGEHVFLQGASGSGKSTLLNILAGMTSAQSGKVQVLGQDLTQLSGARRDRFRAAHIGFVFQQLNLIPYLSVRDNILLAQHFAKHRSDTANRMTLIKHILAELNLPSALLDQAAGRLSIGQQQRVAIARGLVNRPELLIADEPTSALDSDNRDAFMQLLFRLANENGSTLLFVSHDASLTSGFDRIVKMSEINGHGGKQHVA